MLTEALWSPERLDGHLFIPVSMGRSLQLNLVPVWLEVSVYEWLAGACSPDQGCGHLRTTGRKDMERLHFVPLTDLCVRQRRGTIGRGTQIRCLTQVGEKTGCF